MLISTYNLADEVTLTAPASAANSPVSNLQTPNLSDRWVASTTKDGLVWITGDFSSTSHWVGHFALIDHNLTQNAKWICGKHRNSTSIEDADNVSGNFDYSGAWSFFGNDAVGSNVVDSDYLTLDTGGFSQKTKGQFIFKVSITNWSVNYGAPYLKIRFFSNNQTAGHYKDAEITISETGDHLLFIDFDTRGPNWDGEDDPDYDEFSYFQVLLENGEADVTIDYFEWYKVDYSNVTNRGKMPRAYPSIEPFGAQAWGKFMWGGKVSEAERAATRVNSFWKVPDADITTAGRLFIIISDPDNPDGYIQAGRLIVGPYIELSVPPSDLDMEYHDMSKIVETRLLYEWVRTGNKYRKFKVKVDNTSDADEEASFYLHKLKGQTKDVIVSLNPDEDRYHHAYTFYAHFSKDPKVGRRKYVDANSNEYEFTEIV